MRNVPRTIISVCLVAGTAVATAPGGASANAPMWSSPLALGPHDTTTIAAREGLLLASGTANHYDGHSFEGGGIKQIAGPRMPGLFRSTDHGRTWSLGRKVGPSGELTPFASPPDVVAVAAAGGDSYAAFGSEVWRSTDDGSTWRLAGSVGSQVSTLDVLADTRVISGLTSGGLRASSDGGISWTQIGAGLPASRVNELHVTNAGSFLVSTDSGLYRSTDAGASFTQVTSGIIDPSAVAYGSASTGTSVIVLAMEGKNAGTAIYTSSNDGAGFQPRPPAAGGGALPRGSRGAIEATAQGGLFVFYLGTSGGLFRTGNTGLSTYTWERVDPQPGYRQVHDLAVGDDLDPSPATRNLLLYAGVKRGSPVGVSAGETRMLAPGWFDQLEGGRVCGGLVTRPDGALFAACGRHIFRSTDGGATWNSASNGLPYLSTIGDSGHSPLAAGPDGSLWVSGFDRGLYHSNAAVTSWSKVPIPAASTGVVEPHPTNTQIVFAAGLLTNGDTEVLWRTTDGGTTWKPVHEVTRSIVTVDTSPVAPNRVLVATSGDGGFISEDSGATWVKASGLPESSLYRAYFSDADPQVAWAVGRGSSSSMALYRSRNGGQNWTEVGPVKIDANEKATYDIYPSPWDAQTVYVPAIDGDLVVTRDAGDSFAPIDSGLPKDPCSVCEDIHHLAFDMRTRGVMYAAAGVMDPNNGPQSAWVYRGIDPAA